MTRPIPCRAPRHRSRLLVGCASAALALALAVAPGRSEAQGIQASGSVVSGTAEITPIDPVTTQIDVASPTAVIDWTPDTDALGNALDFLRTGATAIYRNPQGGNFAVLNRILPAPNNNIAVIDGTVLGQVLDASGSVVPGGFIAFYSPTGILVGSNATFDVGSLLLTTLDTSPTDFDNFVSGGGLLLQGAPGSTARVQINPGAQITASPENSFFAVVAADVQMSGTARINGSHAYVAGELVSLTFSNGLFFISVPVGTAATGEVVTIDGNAGGPSSTGLPGDNHMIYAVAQASQDPISMLFSGNLGFDPAQSAGIVNGEIILAANYSVFGRNVDTGSVSQGIDAEFRREGATSNVRADITLRDLVAGSSLLAIGTGETTASGESRVAGNLMLVGNTLAQIDSNSPDNFVIDGDVLLDARDYGVVSSGVQSLTELDAQGGTARIITRAGSQLSIGGRVVVTAEAFAGADFSSGIAGAARGGTAEIEVDGGSLLIAGSTRISAAAIGTSIPDIITGAEARGGTARFVVRGGGNAALGSNLLLEASATGAEGDLNNPSTVSNSFGGTALLAVEDTGVLGIGGSAVLTAHAIAGSANASTGGALADAGAADVSVEDSGQLTIDGNLALLAFANGGSNAGGTGGDALAGSARAVTRGAGQLTVVGAFDALADGFGGNGLAGGNGFGGIAGANAITGTIDLQGSASAQASGFGGHADLGFGGQGGIGRGGNAFFQADGSASQRAELFLGSALLIADGTGGDGGASDGQAIAAGNGGDGFGGDFATPNQADPNFGSGAYLLAGGDYGEIAVTGFSEVYARGTGGRGGNLAGLFGAGSGGNGFGGLAQAGLALLGGPGTVGGGLATFAALDLDASARGGDGGFDPSTDEPVGAGGNATGGSAVLTVRSGTVDTAEVSIIARGIGGTGIDGGLGTGGFAGVRGGSGGFLDATRLIVDADGFGGFSGLGRGGDGRGGIAAVEGDGITIDVAEELFVSANGSGASTFDGAGGDGVGGEAYVSFIAAAGSITVGGHTAVSAFGVGGSTQGSFAAGNGRGGTASIAAQAGGTIDLGSAQVAATGLGGEATAHDGGAGQGGTAEMRSIGAGSRLVIQRNVPLFFSEGPGGGSMLNADGIGADTNGGNGIGGSGAGGTIGLTASGGGTIALPANPLADPDTVGPIGLSAIGRGGGSGVDNGVGGTGSGGTALILVENAGSSISMGQALLDIRATAGSSINTALNIAGGEAFGGFRSITVGDGGTLSLTQFEGETGARGGDGSGTGEGGDATGGRNLLLLDNGTLNLVGRLELFDRTSGGDGFRGGDALAGPPGEGGQIGFAAIDSTISIEPDAQGRSGIVLESVATGGDGDEAGGLAEALPMFLLLQNTDLTTDLLRLASSASGGQSFGAGGVAGNAAGGSIFLSLTDSALTTAGDMVILSEALGGNAEGAGGTGGTAIGSLVEVIALRSSLEVSGTSTSGGILQLVSRAVAGGGAVSGNALGGSSRLGLEDASLDADQLFVAATASAVLGAGGNAGTGEARIELAGASDLAADLIEIDASAVTSASGTAQGGTASLVILSTGTASVTADQIGLFANASGSAAQQNTAGRFAVEIEGGSVTAQTFTARAIGNLLSTDLPPSLLQAIGGDLDVGEVLDAEALGDLLVRTGSGGIIGGPRAPATATAVNLRSGGTITIEGDNNAAPGLGGEIVNLLARDIDILAGARIGADEVSIVSTDTANTAVLGGTADGTGFTLTADELGRISARTLAISLPSLSAPSSPNQPDVLVRDLSLAGSAGQGFELFKLFAGSGIADGLVRFEGTLSFANAAADDAVDIAADRIEIVTPGGIRMTGAGNAPTGLLSLTARDIWVADADTIAQLQADRNFAGRDALLAAAAAGSADPLGYVRAGGITLNVGQSLLVRNTGVAFAGGGLLIGGGVLSIVGTGASQSGPGPQLDVFAYGRRQRADGSFVTGEAFFDEVNFNRAAPGTTAYLDASAFNDCIINAGECPQAPPPPGPEVEPPPQINNPTVIEGPILVGDDPLVSDGEAEERFGIDFPERPEAPLISEDPLLDDPVATGGDPSVYGGGAVPPPAGEK